MRKVVDVTPGDRCIIRSNKPFLVYAIRDGGEDATVESLVGPRSADTRKTSFNVPPGTHVIEVDCVADSQTYVDILPNRFQDLPAEGLTRQLEVDQPMSMRDLVANEIARLLHGRGQADEVESIEEANDFDIDDFDWADEVWAHIPEVNDEEPEPVPPIETPQRASVPEPEAQEPVAES